MSIEKFHDFIGNQTRDLPVCSVVHQPTTLLRALRYPYTHNFYAAQTWNWLMYYRSPRLDGRCVRVFRQVRSLTPLPYPYNSTSGQGEQLHPFKQCFIARRFGCTLHTNAITWCANSALEQNVKYNKSWTLYHAYVLTFWVPRIEFVSGSIQRIFTLKSFIIKSDINVAQKML
jgi:hypothetical protein